MGSGLGLGLGLALGFDSTAVFRNLPLHSAFHTYMQVGLTYATASPIQLHVVALASLLLSRIQKRIQEF